MIELQNLSKQYDRFLAVDNLNLTIGDGEFFGLLGPNGAGKTTTISMLLYTPAADNRNDLDQWRTFDQKERSIKKKT